MLDGKHTSIVCIVPLQERCLSIINCNISQDTDNTLESQYAVSWLEISYFI